jgi:hypothetical protein
MKPELHAEARKRGEIQILAKRDVQFPTSAALRLRVITSFYFNLRVQVYADQM